MPTPSHEVRVEIPGQEPAVFRCRADEPVLTAMRRAGHRAVRVGCRNGGCGVCKARVTSGVVEAGRMSRAHVSVAEAAEGWVLLCRVRPRSDLVCQAAPPPRPAWGSGAAAPPA